MSQTPLAAGIPAPRVGAPLPAFTLPSTAGTQMGPRAFKQRQPLLVVCFHGASCVACRGWLLRLADAQPMLGELDAAVLAIARASLAALRQVQRELALPFPLLADGARYGSPSAVLTAAGTRTGAEVALYATDRFGFVRARWLAREADALPTLAEALIPIRDAEQEDCGCGLPAWPVDDLP